MSKGLEALKKLESHSCIDIAQVKGCYKIVEKELKALEIIRKIGILKPYKTSSGQHWLETKCDATKLTQEEYDLLKEVLL